MPRNFIIVVNNYTDEDYRQLLALPYRYLIIGREIGKKGTPHYQCYVEFPYSMHEETLENKVPRAHVEARQYTREQCRNYICDNPKKPNPDYEEHGEFKIQGRRKDLDYVRQCALDDGMREVTTLYGERQIRIAEKYLTYNEAPRQWKTEVIVLYGEPGVGKTELAYKMCRKNDTFEKKDGTKWWDGYDAHECVILDDFRDHWWKLTETLGLLDKFPKRVEVKGGWRQFKPMKIVITSIFPPEEWYSQCEIEPKQQLLRRIHGVHKVTVENRDSLAAEFAYATPATPEVGGNTTRSACSPTSSDS